MREVREKLHRIGHTVTSRWINGEHELLEGRDCAEMARFAQEDIEDLRKADMVLYFVPDSSHRQRGGRHVEFGIALALDIPIKVIGPKENVFHWLPQVRHFATLEDVTLP